MPIANKFNGTYTVTVTNWTGPNSPAGTLVVPSPNATNEVRYTITGQNAVDVTPSFNGDNISFTVSSYTFSASSWNSANGWSGSVSAPGPAAVQSGQWNSSKSGAREHEEHHEKKEVA